jgi:hypothetical protein
MSSDFKTNSVVASEVAGQGKLILKSFGLSLIKPKLFTLSNGLQNVYSEQQNQREGQKVSSNSLFGLPVFGALTLAGNQSNGNLNYEDLDGKKHSVPPITLPIVLIEVSQQKHIVTTDITGRNGSIKEYVSDGDYVINIKGTLTSGANDVYPENELKALLDFLKAPVDIVATSDVLHFIGITNIVVTDYRFEAVEGNRSIVPFEINALSEPAYEITPDN